MCILSTFDSRQSIWFWHAKTADGESFAKKDVMLMERRGMNKNLHMEESYTVLKDQQWSAYIDRSPGAASCSEECFHACVAGCGYKFDVPSQKVDQIHPSRPPPKEKLTTPAVKRILPRESSQTIDDIPGTSA
ncbi:hypothetical protein KY289_005191 [Solanum tuberosum]|nr:hypothetical protein KY289_005191 [Solanum tuberosum]